MELRQLEYFLAVVEAGGFSAAGEALFLSQSALSKQVGKLERELGQALFDRGSRPVALTPAGKVLARTAPEMVLTWRRFLGELGQEVLSLAVTPIAVHYGITEQLAAFAKDHPQFQIKISERENGDMVRLLGEGRAELAFFRPEAEDRQRLELLPIHTDELALLVPAAHPLAQEEMVSLAQLEGEKFILLGSGTQLQTVISAAFQRAGLRPNIMFEGSNGEAIASLVASGAGVSIMLRRVAEHLARGNGRLKPLAFAETTTLQIALACEKDGPRSPGGRALWSFFRGLP